MSDFAVIAAEQNEPLLFADLATEELRAMARKTCDRANWKDWDRGMLLAFFHNRHGKFVPSAD